MNSYRVALAFYSLGCLCLPVSALSQAPQPPPEYLVDQYYRAAKRTIAIVRDDIRGVLNRTERRVLDEIEFRVNRNDWNVFGVFAQKRGDQRTIEVSMGFILALDHIDTAVVAVELDGREKHNLWAYVHEFALSIHDNIRRMRRGETLQPNPSFPEFVGWSSDAWREVLGDPQFEGYKETVKLHGTAFIVAHEIAHHLLDHLENTNSSIAEEMAADSLAVDLGIRAGYTPLLATTAFLFFSALEGDVGIYDGTGTHPPPLCRFAFLAREGIKDARDDPEMIDYLRQTGQYESWFAQVEQLEQVVEERMHCP